MNLPKKILMDVMKDGRLAFHRGVVIRDCPYQDPDLKQYWLSGWKAAKQEIYRFCPN